uniref:hypothetical protein n=1 Tax=Parasynechococcus sp. TaxID=3101203 RepID=UPI00370370C0
MTRLTILLVLIGFSPLPAGSAEAMFLADDAQVACRAILPGCFTRHDWHRLCLEDPSIQTAHPTACAAAA